MEGLPPKEKEEAFKAALPRNSPQLSDEEIEEEEWREIESHGGYYVSTFGRVKGRKFEILAQRDLDGYRCLSINDVMTGSRDAVRVHRLVALAFIPNPNNLPEVHHKDKNRSNNKVSNLAWTDREGNNNDKSGIIKPTVPYEYDDIEGEIWKPIEGDFRHPYHVSNFGRVFMKYGKKSRGSLATYRSVGLTLSDGKTKNFLVHILVATAFLGRPPQPRMLVNHKDLNKHNNKLDNLEWVTSSENSMHAFRMGARQQKAVIQLTRGGTYVAEFPSISEAGRQMGCAKQSIIWAIRTNGSVCGYLWRRKN